MITFLIKNDKFNMKSKNKIFVKLQRFLLKLNGIYLYSSLKAKTKSAYMQRHERDGGWCESWTLAYML